MRPSGSLTVGRKNETIAFWVECTFPRVLTWFLVTLRQKLLHELPNS
jgi:hypothetical protein